MCILVACPDPSEPGVWWRDDRSWVRYELPAAHRILLALAKQASKVSLGELSSGSRYFVDLVGMQQINLATGHKREVKVVGILPHAQKRVKSQEGEGDLKTILQKKLAKTQKDECLATERGACKHCDGKGTSIVINLSIDRLCERVKPAPRALIERKLLSILLSQLANEDIVAKSLGPKVKPHEIMVLTRNTYCSNGNLLHEEFLDAFESAAHEYPSFIDDVMKLLNNDGTLTTSLLHYVFFGSRKNHFGTILERGLKEFEGKAGFNWFGQNAKTSLPFARSEYPASGVYKLLVFLVVVPPEDSKSGKDSLRVTATKARLPLGIVEIKV